MCGMSLCACIRVFAGIYLGHKIVSLIHYTGKHLVVIVIYIIGDVSPESVLKI